MNDPKRFLMEKKLNDRVISHEHDKTVYVSDAMTLFKARTETVANVLCSAGFFSLLRELKEELKGHISEHELDDGDELDEQTEELILGWIENFFENKIYDIENGL